MSAAPIEIPIRYDEAQVRSAYRRLFLWTQLGWIIGFAVIFFFGVTATISAKPHFAWIGGFFLGASIFYFYSIFSSWRGVSRSALEKAGEEMLVRLTESEIHFAGPDFNSSISWDKIENAGVLEGSWYLDISGNYTLLPRPNVTAEADTFIRARFKERKIRLARWSDQTPMKRTG